MNTMTGWGYITISSVLSIYPGDPTLTTENLMMVVKELEHHWDDVCFRLGVPYSKREEIRRLNQSDHQRMEAIINHYVKSPTASWKVIAETLQKMKLHKQADEVTARYIKGMEVNYMNSYETV